MLDYCILISYLYRRNHKVYSVKTPIKERASAFSFSFLNHLPKAPGWVLTALPNNTYTK